MLAGLLERRRALWRGRISDYASDESARSLALILLAYLLGIVGVIVFIVLAASISGLAGGIALAAFVVGAAVILMFAWAAAKRAALDVVSQYGLDESKWRQVKLKTPDQFDRWIASVRNL